MALWNAPHKVRIPMPGWVRQHGQSAGLGGYVYESKSAAPCASRSVSWMKWVTRERARVDRIACPWLIRNFVDREAVFLFVPAERVLEVAKSEGATPFDIPGVELGHHGEYCSFDSIVKKYAIGDPAVLEMAKVVRGADTSDRNLTPESPGLNSIAEGFRAIAMDDFDNMSKQFYVYDALHAFFKAKAGQK